MSELVLGTQVLASVAAKATEDRLVSQVEAAAIVGRHPHTIQYHVYAGHLQTYLRGYVLQSAVVALFAEKDRKRQERLKQAQSDQS